MFSKLKLYIHFDCKQLIRKEIGWVTSYPHDSEGILLSGKKIKDIKVFEELKTIITADCKRLSEVGALLSAKE